MLANTVSAGQYKTPEVGKNIGKQHKIQS